MLTPRQELESRVAAAANRLFPEPPPGPYVKPCPDSRHGDFQTNLALVQARTAQLNPRELAQQLISALEIADLAETPEIAGPGFLNFRLQPDYLAKQLTARAQDERLGVPVVAAPQTVLIDFSGPNIAKEMHVGHLRSTILGDALARLYRFLGHRVITDNHLGDWGTSFGLILLGYKREGDAERLAADPFAHLEEIYKKITAESLAEPALREKAKRELVKLQQGDAENLRLWRQFIDLSLAALQKIYMRLDVKFDHWLGESAYNEALPGVVQELLSRGVARESEGAIAIFSDGTLEPKNDPFLVAEKIEGETQFRDIPLLIQKSDEGFNYATTDLATLRYRHDHFAAEQVLYVVDGRQQLHFRQLFAAAQRWGYGEMKLEHVWFGTILGPDKKPIKSREGGDLKLKALLAEAEERAGRIIAEKRPEMPEAERAAVAQIVGLGALKYADLAQNRNLDYVFAWEKLLAFDGNTAPYLQNAYVRIRAIFRKAGLTLAPVAPVLLHDVAELALAKKLLDFADSVQLAADEYRPHYLCNYLFELATLFHKFYEACPVLKDEVPAEIRASRLVLCELTARTLRCGLNLLGIETVEQM